jgi:MYXO-CTERM domain-containing protein
MALAALAGMANAQSVEFRIVEEAQTPNNSVVIGTGTGTNLSSSNTFGNYAVQARVTAGAAGSALGGFSFDIVIPGEPDSNGTMAKLHISNSDGTYWTGAGGVVSSVGIGGLAKTFTYLAGLNGAFNGQINTSSGTFTNQPGQQEIGLVTASATGSALLGTPGMDPGFESNPSTWSGYGTGTSPNSGDTASLDPALAGPYFAAGQFIDVYRFRYTTSNFTGRTFNITLANPAAQAFNQFLFNNGSWGPQATTVAAGSVTVTPLSVTVTPAPASAALLGLGGLVAARRRRIAK